ncbi:DUF2961 domain-containing protein [Kutzneria albida]|uniref:DUF2961 domain-containing protein n=1 Tax=Kutzneria albida DSM 43870 TaxID=1449976 RepID=W5WAF6_9PSEU|nr:DUF2961 domain-containing protein [Kutzneria albida]AHH95159.1 hypothetical protein KALB_1788 [Kutzneria albida DSM 43870]
MRWTALGTLVAAALLVPVTPVAAAPKPAAKGPIGWDLYRQVDALAQLRPGSQARQFSSFDRAGANEDGFEGTYSCLRKSTEGCVIAERSGPGEIASMWFTQDFGDVSATGWIKVELDGRTVLSAKLTDLTNGALGAPFVWPLVANAQDTQGGVVVKVPMPYRESMRVTVQNNPNFYHVTYREFADAEGVRTFDPADKAQDVVDRLRRFGVADPKPVAPGARTVTKTADVPAGAVRDFAQLTGSGQITQLRVKLPQVARAPRVDDDGRAFKQGASSFTVRVDPANQGVRLTRRLDPKTGNQQANLLVDGKPAGTWQGTAPAPGGTWADQSIDIPAALTKGKSLLHISNQSIAADVDFTEFRYDVHSRVGDDLVRTDVLDLGPAHPGEEMAHGYAITGQSWSGSNISRYPVSAAQVAASDALLAGARLRLSFDGRSTVDSPVGEFFGSGLGEYDTRTLMSSIDAGDGGWYTAWWPMPYARSATVQLVNAAGAPITGATVEVTSAADPAVAKGLGAGGNLAYFSTTSHSGPVLQGKDWNLVDTTGQGVFYGVTHTMRGQTVDPISREYLEGDERSYVDGAVSPTMSGTGTEDFYESGWYFLNGTYSMPLAGAPAYEVGEDGCAHDCTGAYRLMIDDALSFSSGLTFDIEHGPVNQTPADYGSTAYWYGRSDSGLAASDAVDLAEDTSRAAHGYQAAGETRTTLQSTYEGRQSGTQVSHGVTASTGVISFRAKVSPTNSGVRLERVSDQNLGGQRAQVYVDGQLAGTWSQALANQHSRWLDDNFELPAALTSGKSAVTVRIVPVGGAPAWSAASYRIRSHLTG